jgi:hypothetical protein
MQPSSRTRQPLREAGHSGIPQNEQNPGSGLHDDSPVGNMAEDSLTVDNRTNNLAPGVFDGVSGLFGQSGTSVSGEFDSETWASGFNPASFFCSPARLPTIENLGDEESLDDACPAVLTEEDGSSICLDTQNSMTAQLLGSTGDMDPSLIRRYRYNTSETFHFKNLNIQSVSSGPNPTQFLMSDPSIFSASRDENGGDKTSILELRQTLEDLIPANIGLRLIDLFEKIFIPQYPMLFPPGHLDPNTTPPYLLASTYLIAGPFAKFDEKLCIDFAYEKPSAVALHDIINKAIPYEIHAPKLCIIRTLLILVIRPYPSPIVLDSGFKWSQFATLVACAHTLGLHLDPRSWKISAWEIFQRQCLSCLIYSTDKWLALSLGRPPLLHYDNWLVTSPNQSHFLLSGLDALTWSKIMKRAELDSLLDRVLTQL